MRLIKIYPRTEFEGQLWEDLGPDMTRLPVRVKARTVFGKTLKLSDGRLVEFNSRGEGYLEMPRRAKCWVFSLKGNYEKYLEENCSDIITSYRMQGATQAQAQKAAEKHVKQFAEWKDINLPICEGQVV